MSSFARAIIPDHIRQAINNAPMLTEAEEIAAVETRAFDLLARSHLRLVVRVAGQYLGYGHPFEDLYGEGCVGLMKACERYKLGTGARFGTYAVWWIRASIGEFVLVQRSLVKMGTTAWQKKLFFHRTEIYKGTAEEVADKFNVLPEHVKEMRERLAADASLNAPVVDKRGEEGMEYIDVLPDDTLNPEEQLSERQEAEHSATQLQDSLAILNEREKDITLARAHGATLEELSQRHGVSRERCRQIEVASIEKMKRAAGLLPPLDARWCDGKLKQCSACGKHKDVCNFYRNRRAKDGRQEYCKACSKAKRQAWGAANREKQNAASMARYYRRKQQAKEAAQGLTL